MLPRLAPDLLYLSSKLSTTSTDKLVTLTGTTSLVTALQLTGKWSISYLNLSTFTNSGTVTVRLTIDDEVIWNTSVTGIVNQTVAMLGTGARESYISETYMCNSSLKLEVMHSTNTTMNLYYLSRPIFRAWLLSSLSVKTLCFSVRSAIACVRI